MDYTFKFLKIGNIGGNLYYTKKRSDAVIIYGIGAPISPDSGNLPDAPIILDKGVEIFVPDYIGYGRSDGVFTPRNCIKTFLELYDKLTDGCVGINFYSMEKVKLKYKRVLVVGRSLGGAYVPLLPRFNKEIKEMAILCPTVDQKAQGEHKGEESNEDFLRSMKKDGYYHLYRGILSKVWEKHLENEDGLSPMDNIKYLKEAKLFIGHGKKDKCIHYSKSVKYFEKIKSKFPDRKSQFVLKLYPTGDHGSSTTNPAIKDFIDWILHMQS